MTKESRRALAQINRAMAGLEKGVAKDVESGRISKSRARTMRRVAELIREVVALEKRAGVALRSFRSRASQRPGLGVRVAPSDDRARDECGRGSRTHTAKKNWSGREDLNLRPPDPQSGALPGCATPRCLKKRQFIPRLSGATTATVPGIVPIPRRSARHVAEAGVRPDSATNSQKRCRVGPSRSTTSLTVVRDGGKLTATSTTSRVATSAVCSVNSTRGVS